MKNNTGKYLLVADGDIILSIHDTLVAAHIAIGKYPEELGTTPYGMIEIVPPGCSTTATMIAAPELPDMQIREDDPSMGGLIQRDPQA